MRSTHSDSTTCRRAGRAPPKKRSLSSAEVVDVVQTQPHGQSRGNQNIGA